MPASSFHALLVAQLPKLRTHAMALTRDRAVADDLVQDAALRALAAQDSFTPGSNFAAWVHCILHNRFLGLCRKRRATVSLEELPDGLFVATPTQQDRIFLQQLERGLAQLAPEHHEALVLATLQGLSHAEIAAATGCAVGTAKSRLFRARRQLEQWLLGEADPAPSGSEAPCTAEITPRTLSYGQARDRGWRQGHPELPARVRGKPDQPIAAGPTT